MGAGDDDLLVVTNTATRVDTKCDGLASEDLGVLQQNLRAIDRDLGTKLDEGLNILTHGYQRTKIC